jgi:molybdate transport system substrate-binding protein
MAKMKFSLSALTAVLILLTLGCSKEETAGKTDDGTREVIVFAAASTTDIMTKVAEGFTLKEKEKGNIVRIRLNPASSGSLARQIEAGADADIFISASLQWMDYVGALEVIKGEDEFLRNSLVLIVPETSPIGTLIPAEGLDLPAKFSGRLSMGDPAHVPAGKYAKEALEYFGWYPLLEADRILPAADVRSALSVVEMGETELGIVYRTDALKSASVNIVGTFPETSHAPVVYLCALLDHADKTAEAFYDYLLSDEDVLKLYRDEGFITVQKK